MLIAIYKGSKLSSVKDINANISDLVDALPKIKLMGNQPITEEMLKDKKHLNKEGFSILLGNIRFMIFEKLPEFRQRRFKFNANPRFHNNQQPYTNRHSHSNGNNLSNNIGSTFL